MAKSNAPEMQQSIRIARIVLALLIVLFPISLVYAIINPNVGNFVSVAIDGLFIAGEILTIRHLERAHGKK